MTKIELIKKISPLWNVLTTEEKCIFYDNLTLVSYTKRASVYQEGETAQYMYFLISGLVKIYRVGHSGRLQIMRIVSPGQTFGYRAYFSGTPYLTNACTLDHSQLAYVPISLIDCLVRNNHQVALLFIKWLCDDLGESDYRSVCLTQSHVRGRLAETLLFIQRNYGVSESGNTLNLSLSREDLAALSNMTTANAIRTLSMFVEEGLIEVFHRKIQILNEKELERIARIG